MSRGQSLSTRNKFSILTQVANAFSYLHAKNIIHGRLSDHNIFLEKKVMVSILDYAPTQPNLQFYAPEIGRLLTLDNLCCNPSKSKEGDVFAFGTLIYLLSVGRLPLHSLDPDSLLSKVSLGEMASTLIEDCLNTNLALIIRHDK